MRLSSNRRLTPERLAPRSFLQLLEGEAQGLAQLVLTEPEKSAAQMSPAADVDVDRVWSPGRIAARRRTSATGRFNIVHYQGPPSRALN